MAGPLSVKMRRNIIFIISVFFLSYFFYGCLNFKTDVTDDEKLLGGYDKNKEYIILRDIFLQSDSSGLSGDRLILIPESSFKRCLGRHATAPKSIEQYRNNPEEATKTEYGKIPVIGIVTKGTKLKLSRIERNMGLNWFYGTHDSLTPFAKILTGEFEGKEVDITDISIYYQNDSDDGPFIYKPEEGVIEVLEQKKST